MQMKIANQMESKKVDSIGIDLDSGDAFALLVVYLKCKKLFPNSKIEVEASSSRKGYHVVVQKKVSFLENIYYRVMLGDDSNRVFLSLKKFFMNPEEKYLDLMFEEKGGKKVEKIDLEGMLKDYKEIEEIKENIFNPNYSLKRLLEISEEIKPKLPTISKWITAIPFPMELKENVKKVCEDIWLRDLSFEYQIFQNFLPKGDLVLVIFSSDKDTAIRRGVWMCKKALKGNKLGYWVKEVW